MLEIREIKEKDLTKLARMEENIFSDAWSLEGLRDSFRNPQTILLGAWDSDSLIGYVIFYHVLDEGEIARIAVDESRRRLGVARELLTELGNICEDKGISRWMLDVREHNLAAISFYHSYGFVQDGMRKNFYTDPAESAVLMSLELGR